MKKNKDELNMVKTIVEKLLREEPDTRSNDDLLYLFVIETIGVNPETLTLEAFLMSYRWLDLPTMGTVTRLRRRVQERRPELRASEHVAHRRRNLEKIFREHFSKQC